MKKSFLIIGLGRFGLALVKTLSNLKCEVLAIDMDEESVNEASQYISHCLVCDATKLHNLEELSLSNIDHAVVAIGNNLQASILTTINLKELKVKHITVRVDQHEYVSVMERIGADDTIIPEEASAISLANQIMSDTIIDYYDVADEYGIVQIQVPEDFKEKSLIELDPRNNFDINVIAIIREEKFFIPKGNDVIKANDIVMVIGKKNKITKFDHYLTK